MERQLWEHHLQQIQLCTCQSHCQRPEQLRLRHTSCRFCLVSFWGQYLFKTEMTFQCLLNFYRQFQDSSDSFSITLFGQKKNDSPWVIKAFLDICQCHRGCHARHHLIWANFLLKRCLSRMILLCYACFLSDMKFHGPEVLPTS